MGFNDVSFTEFPFSADTGLLVNIKTSLFTSIPNIRPVTTSSSFFIDLIFNTNYNINFGKNWIPHLQIAEEIAVLSLNASCSMIHGRLKRAAKRCSWGPCCVPCQYLQLFTASNKTHLSLRGLSVLLGGVTLTWLCSKICILHIYGGLLKISNG